MIVKIQIINVTNSPVWITLKMIQKKNFGDLQKNVEEQKKKCYFWHLGVVKKRGKVGEIILHLKAVLANLAKNV